MIGIEKSITIKSGLRFLAFSMASRPFIASPQTSKGVQDARNDRRSLRTSTWSSTISILFDLMERPHSASVTIDDDRVCSILDIFLLFDGDGDMRTWQAGIRWMS